MEKYRYLSTIKNTVRCSKLSASLERHNCYLQVVAVSEVRESWHGNGLRRPTCLSRQVGRGKVHLLFLCCHILKSL